MKNWPDVTVLRNTYAVLRWIKDIYLEYTSELTLIVFGVTLGVLITIYSYQGIWP